MGNRHFCCWGGDRSANLDEMKREIESLKVDMEKMKEKQGG
jgi:hypothetical protein